MADVAAAALTWPLTGTLPQPGDSMRIRVRRCLFGPVDHDSTIRFQEESMKQMLESDKKRWNFDFHQDKPMPGGRFSWELTEKNKSEPTENTTAKEQTQVTRYFRKRKAICHDGKAPKIRRRSST